MVWSDFLRTSGHWYLKHTELILGDTFSNMGGDRVFTHTQKMAEMLFEAAGKNIRSFPFIIITSFIGSRVAE